MKKFVLGILTFIWLGFWIIFAQTIFPDSADVSIRSPIIVWETANLKVTIKKNDAIMRQYTWTVWFSITDAKNGELLKENEYTLPSNSMYTFLPWDLWVKEFQRWLAIKKEWTFYVEVQDMMNDGVLWRWLVEVTKKVDKLDVKKIQVRTPEHNSNIYGEKVDILAGCPELPNSLAKFYIGDEEVGTWDVGPDGWVNKTIFGVEPWQHELLVEIPDANWEIVWRSDKIFFTTYPTENGGIKNVTVDPENWLMIEDSTVVTVYTDDSIETVKMRLSDRPRNDPIVMSKDKIWQFSQTIFLTSTWEISLSFDVTDSNDLVDAKWSSYENYKTITVSDIPVIFNENVETDIEWKIADVSWEVTNSGVVSSYLLDRWDEGWLMSWQEWTEIPDYRFVDVPYDTIIKLNITPYRNKKSRHWAPSKTIQFVISKPNLCWNWICDEWETYETCPEDCWPMCWNWICEEWETPENCPEDCWPVCWNWICEPWETPENCPEDCLRGQVSTCVIQNVPVRTTKIWESYYLIWDKAKDVTKYLVYSSSTSDPRTRTKVYETTDTSYEYPFDYNAKHEMYMYFRVVWICE